MLKVRYGSGWRRMVTACAARPSLCKSRHWKSPTPSSGERRAPSTAFDKIRSTVFKCYPSRRQTEFDGELIVLSQAREFLGAEVVANQCVEVAPAITGIEPQRAGFALGDLSCVCASVLLRLMKCPFRGAEVHPASDGPHRVDHRKLGPRGPLFS